MKEVCEKCNSNAINPNPPKYSPEDRFGDFRRKFIKESSDKTI